MGVKHQSGQLLHFSQPNTYHSYSPQLACLQNFKGVGEFIRDTWFQKCDLFSEISRGIMGLHILSDPLS